jgi:hypothetical protein
MLSYLLRTSQQQGQGNNSTVIRLQRIHNFWCSMLVFTPFA